MNNVDHIQRAAEELIRHASQCGVVVTIETVSNHPPAMGNVRMVAHARPARTPSGSGFNLDLACRMAMMRIRQDIDTAYQDHRFCLASSGIYAKHEMDRRHIRQAIDRAPNVIRVSCCGDSTFIRAGSLQ